MQTSPPTLKRRQIRERIQSDEGGRPAAGSPQDSQRAAQEWKRLAPNGKDNARCLGKTFRGGALFESDRASTTNGPSGEIAMDMPTPVAKAPAERVEPPAQAEPIPPPKAQKRKFPVAISLPTIIV